MLRCISPANSLLTSAWHGRTADAERREEVLLRKLAAMEQAAHSPHITTSALSGRCPVLQGLTPFWTVDTAGVVSLATHVQLLDLAEGKAQDASRQYALKPIEIIGPVTAGSFTRDPFTLRLLGSKRLRLKTPPSAPNCERRKP